MQFDQTLSLLRESLACARLGAGMAHKSFAMPLLKLTKRPNREKKEVEYLHRGVQGPDRSTSSIIYDQVVQFSQSNDLSLQSTQCEVQLSHEDLSFPTVTEREPISYEIERKVSVLGWESQDWVTESRSGSFCYASKSSLHSLQHCSLT